MGDIQNDIESKAEELKGGDEQHLGDAMDEAGPESKEATEASESEKKRRLA